MLIEPPISDTSRAIQHDSDQSWPQSVKIQVLWRDKSGRPLIRSEVITADAFFGRGSHGAPLQGEAIVAMIERMRKKGPPKVTRRIRRD